MNSIILLLIKTLVSVFFSVLFIQSGFDKVVDWKGNYEWLKDHFAGSILATYVKPLLITLTAFELLSGLVSAVGIVFLFVSNYEKVAFAGIFLSGVTILMLFTGQRIAKKYEGAVSLAVYFVITVIGLFLYIK